MNKVLWKVLWLVVPTAVTVGTFLAIANWAGGYGLELAVIGLPIVLVTVLAVHHGFFLPSDYLARWTKSHGITITDENRDVVLRYLLRGRRIRTCGALIGFVTYAIFSGVVGGDHVGVGWLRAVFGGYLLGAAVAEFWAFRPQLSTRRVASLSPRALSDYAPRYAIVLMRAAPVAIVAFAAGWRYIPRGHFIGNPTRLVRPDFAEALAWTGIAIILVLLVETTARRIVTRPQPVVSEALVEADDAIRSTAMHGLIGAGLALQLGILSRLSQQMLLFTSATGFHAWLGLLAAVTGLGALFAWLRLGIDQVWVVRRTQRRQEVAA